MKENRLKDDLLEGNLHPRDVSYRTHIPFDDLMAMWRGEKAVDFHTSSSIARLTGRRSDHYQTDKDSDGHDR